MSRKKKAEPKPAMGATEADRQEDAGVSDGPALAPMVTKVKLEALSSALRARIGGRITLRIDGNDIVATGNQREARTPLDGRYPNEICDALVGGLLR